MFAVHTWMYLPLPVHPGHLQQHHVEPDAEDAAEDDQLEGSVPRVDGRDVRPDGYHVCAGGDDGQYVGRYCDDGAWIDGCDAASDVVKNDL